MAKTAQTIISIRRTGDGKVSTEFARPVRVLVWTGLVLALAYLVAGVIVAISRDYFAGLGSADGVFSALGEILVWPLVLLGVDITLR
ncbi:hypothetical protein [Amycolatopsis anabasis]|uniref:hypothetical protein n=1 Tax=Amycolatopsis anabasis TaxID=1840409 RepID=UPI00131C439F|nr:hypothetical protein [Amycolatopsis anabasis]